MMEFTPQNRLQDAASPYLRQHKDNPVHWQVWGPAAFAAAKALQRPVLLSVGYAACHWCHVMAHESFENPATAQLMNDLFINIKLDREERPDLDQLYQHALALMGQQGGWPLTMFLAPDGAPFWGGTYFPPVARHGLPAFNDVLRGIAEGYATEQDKIAFNMQSIRDAITARHSLPPLPPVTPEIVSRAALHLLNEIDAKHGGLAGPHDGAPKFPQLTRLRLLWDHSLRAHDARCADALLFALLQMCGGGLYDHIGGGFHRYCVDAAWQVPHFEKMLDDQAMFIELLADVVSHRPHPFLLQALEDTVAFVLRDMRCEKTGLCISSLDADSAGGEGACYLWTHKEIHDLLGAQATLFCEAYNIAPDGNWNESPVLHGNIPHRYDGAVPRNDAQEDLLRHCRKKLLYVRHDRNQPARDDKILADANARLIAALSIAGRRLDRPEWQQAAEELFSRLAAFDNDGLPQVIGGNDPLLDAQATLARAALVLAESRTIQNKDAGQNKNAGDLQKTAATIAQRILAAYQREDGALLALPANRQDSFLPVLPMQDTPAPAASATVLDVLCRLSHIEPQGPWQQAAGRLAGFLAAPAREGFAMMASCLCAFQFYQNPVLLHGDAARFPRHARLYVPAGQWIADSGENLRVCTGTTCLPPAADAAAADAALAQALRLGLHKAANL